MAARRALCAQESRDRAEPIVATASRVDHWLLVEYQGAWQRDAVGESHLSEPVKRHLSEQVASLPHSKLLFIRRRSRRSQDGLRVYVASSAERDPWLVGLELGQYDDLLRLDVTGGRTLGRPVEEPLLLVCTHGKRDRCCAAFGRALYDELRAQPEREWVWQSTHVGGDRFAGNVVVLPEGLYYGRIDPGDVRPLLDRQHRGEVLLDHYRGLDQTAYRGDVGRSLPTGAGADSVEQRPPILRPLPACMLGRAARRSRPTSSPSVVLAVITRGLAALVENVRGRHPSSPGVSRQVCGSVSPGTAPATTQCGTGA